MTASCRDDSIEVESLEVESLMKRAKRGPGWLALAGGASALA
jgi:hypothetical protein